MRITTKLLVSTLSLAFLSTTLLGVYLPQSSGTSWSPGPDLGRARDGAAAVFLHDGRALVCGGADANGVTATTAFSLGGSFAPAASMETARRDHGLVVLHDGRALAIGGTGSDGAAIGSAEIFDPFAGSWAPAGTLSSARSNAIALVLLDGRVLVVGGEREGSPCSELELFDPATGAFSTSSVELPSPRSDLAAAMLLDGRVLIAGGASDSVALRSTLLFDAELDTLAAGPDLSVPRAGATATCLQDGSVLVSGGSDGSIVLASSERFDPVANVFLPVAESLATPRRDHRAILLPGNGSVLLLGGMGATAALGSSERFLPWSSEMMAAGSLAVPRPGAADCAEVGGLLVLGGSGLDSSELFRFPAIATDRYEYLPGETALIAGTGFQALDTVTLQVTHVTGACVCAAGHVPFSVTADTGGRIASTWYVDPEDSLGALFRMTADGADGRHAELRFADSPKVGSVSVGSQSPTSVAPGSSAAFVVTVTRGTGPGSSGSFTATMSITTVLPAGVTASFSPNPVSFAPSQDSRTSTLTLATTGATPPGAASFTAQAATSANDFATGDGSLSVAGSQTITFPTLAGKTYGDAPFALVATASSGLPVGFSVVSGPATIAGSTLTITGAGSVTVRASQPGNGSYGAAPDVDRTFAIAQALLSVTPADATREYGEANPGFSGSIVGIQYGDAITATYGSTATALSSVGGFPISATLHDPDGKLGNYDVDLNEGTLTITKAPLTVAPADATREYGEANPGFSGSIVGIKNSDPITATYASTATALSLVGDFAITATLVDPAGKLGNYEVDLNEGTLTITKASLTVTPADATREYGESNPGFSGSIVGIKNSDDITASYASIATALSFVGDFAITATLHDPEGKLGNYEVDLNEGTLTITKAPLTVTPADATREYGESNPGFSGSIVGIKNGDDITATYSSTATALSSVGDFPITATLVDPDGKLVNYEVDLNEGTLTVGKASLTVTSANAEREYGEANPSFDGSIVGIKNGDDITATYGSTATALSFVGDFAITATLHDPDGKLGNYEVDLNEGTLTVTKAPLTVTPADATRKYGEANPGFSGSIVGIKNSDDVTATYGSTATALSFVGDFAITATLHDPDGKLGNYEVDLNEGSLTITKAPLTVTPADATREYGEANPGFSGSVVGIKNSDAITASYATTATAVSSVGDFAITATLHDPDGKLGNYEVDVNEGRLTITKAPLSVTPANVSREYGASNPSLTGSIVGLKNGDAITANYGTTATVLSSVGDYPITAALVDADGKASNYEIDLGEGTLTVTKAPLTVTPANASRTYGASNPAFTGSIVGLKNGDPITASYSTTATSASSPGNYPIVATLSDPSSRLGNYQLTQNSGTLTIGLATLTVQAHDKVKILGSANPAFTGTITGLQNGDAITATFSSVANSSSPVGSYPIVPALVDPTGKLGNYSVNVVNGTLSIRYAPAGTTCSGIPSHVIRQPINQDGTSVFKQKSSVPAKFRVCDAAGNSVGTPGLVTSFNLIQIVQGTSSQDVNEPVDSTNASSAFQFDPSDQQWIFVINTKTLSANSTYTYRIVLNDGSDIVFTFGLK